MLPNYVKNFWFAMILCACLAANAQQWHSTNSIPLFRGTSFQSVVVTNMQQSSACLSNLRQLALAGRSWSDNQSSNFMPSNWQQFTNNIEFARLLYCPKDTAHPQLTNWSDVNFSAISYRIVSPEVSVDDLSKVFIECDTHTNRVFVNGTAKEAAVYDRDIPLALEGGFRSFIPALSEAKKRSYSIGCVNNLREIGLAARVYSQDHNHFLPTSLSQVTNELVHSDVFYCPAERTKIPSSFAQVNYSNVSYNILAPGISEDYPDVKYAECRTHENYLLVDGAASQGTNSLKRLIVGDPFSQTVEPGRLVEFAVLVNTNADQLPFQYQWRKQQPFDNQGRPFTNTVMISGATNRTLVFTNVQVNQEGYYDVVVRDAIGGYEQSFMAYLRVEPLTNLKNGFAWEPLSCAVNLRNIGLAAGLWIDEVNGSYYPSNFYYMQNQLGWPLSLYCPNDTNRQPQSLWSSVNFEDTSYILYTNVPAEDPTNVLARCKIHDFRLLSDGSVPDLVNFPSITQQPVDLTVAPGGTATFAVSAAGPDLVFQWKRNGTNVASGSNLTLSDVTTNHAGQYTVVVSNSLGFVVSRPAILTVHFRIFATNTATGLVLSWPTNIPYQLQFTTNALDQGIWWDLMGIASPYKVTPTNRSRFFRLVAP